MTLTPTDLARLAAIIVFAIVLATRDDPRWWNSVKDFWISRVGALCAKRRDRKAFNQPVPGWNNFKVR